MPRSPHFLLVYPTTSNVFYETLARRLLSACEEISLPVESCAATRLCDISDDQLVDTTLLLVNPVDCAYKVGDTQQLFSRLSAARKRVAILAEAVETQWFENQFRLPIQYDALIDVGFISQQDKLKDTDLPYRFLFNGVTRGEDRMLMQPPSLRRHIPWAIVGHRTDGRAKLAAELIESLDPAGFVFLPNPGMGVRKGGSTIGPLGLTSVLSRTKFYVWNSHHDFAYYESFRFVEAILAGAVPCKVDVRATWEHLGIPGIFSSVNILCDSIQTKGFANMQRSAREFYLSQGKLADHLQTALENV